MVKNNNPVKFLVVLIIALLAVLFLYLKPVLRWKTIESQAGVSISYPSSWYSQDSPSLLIVSDFQGPLITQDRPSSEETVHLEIAKVPKKAGDTLEKAEDTVRSLYKDYQLTSEKNQIETYPATKVVVEGLGMQFLLVDKGDSIYWIKIFTQPDVGGLSLKYKSSLLKKVAASIHFR